MSGLFDFMPNIRELPACFGESSIAGLRRSDGAPDGIIFRELPKR